MALAPVKARGTLSYSGPSSAAEPGGLPQRLGSFRAAARPRRQTEAFTALAPEIRALGCAVGVDMAAIDCAGAFDALCVQGELTLRNMLLRGIAPASAARVDTRTQFQLTHCDLWPSFVIVPGAQARPSGSPYPAPQAGA